MNNNNESTDNDVRHDDGDCFQFTIMFFIIISPKLFRNMFIRSQHTPLFITSWQLFQFSGRLTYLEFSIIAFIRVKFYHIK